MLKISDDSRKIKEGDIFIALKKENDGHNYISEAIKNGANKIIAEKGLYEVETIIVPDTHEYLVNYLKENYYEQIKDIKLIGMTGTNGKTTTCFLLYQALKKLGKKTAYIGTIGFYIDEKVKDLNNTTPDILEIYEMLLECSYNNIEYVVMEVSSHSLSMDRVKGLEFKYGVFSNLTRDHLDYHETMEKYAFAKRKLFDMVTDKTFVNKDDEYAHYFMRNNSITYGFNDADYQILEYHINMSGTKFKVNEKWYNDKLIGKHNIYNMLVVISVLTQLGFKDFEDIIASLEAPKGRMDVTIKEDNLIIVDYAHTPDAVKKILEAVKELNPSKIITIIGCGGDRDKTKRPIMGEIATENSDHVIFTNDNPRTEDENNIVNDIVQSLDTTNYEIILEREKAIIRGIQILLKNDILLVLGKGHETYQVIGKTKYHFDDLEIILANL